MEYISSNILKLDKNIVIYVHMPFDLSNGGVTVQYYLAFILDSFDINIRICNIYDNNKPNSIFNKFINDKNFKETGDKENTIVIYSEGIIGNPLYAKYVVRWMLSKLGQNMPINYYLSWDPNELIYFFNTENELIDKKIDYKQLAIFYINPIFKNIGRKREGVCFTKRKQIIKNHVILHTKDSFEVTRKHTQDDYLEIFNNYEKFVSYDPISFLTIIATICGCISIVCPISNISKKDYFKMTALYEYMIEKNIDSIYGIAYGDTQNELDYSKNTLHLVYQQIIDIQNWFIKKYVNNFITNLNNWKSNTNTLINYINSVKLSTSFIGNFDVAFYRKLYNDIKLLSDSELLEHYIKQGKKQGRLCSENTQIISNSVNNINSRVIDGAFIENINISIIDLHFYRNHYKDLQHMTNYELIQHYNNFGKQEGRFINRKQFEAAYSKY
jgi:hypothetical protein